MHETIICTIPISSLIRLATSGLPFFLLLIKQQTAASSTGASLRVPHVQLSFLDTNKSGASSNPFLSSHFKPFIFFSNRCDRTAARPPVKFSNHLSLQEHFPWFFYVVRLQSIGIPYVLCYH